MNAYSPSNSARDCPATTDPAVFAASSNLPPTPNEQLCSCMVANLTCKAKSSVNTDDFGDLFSTACAKGNCDGIDKNGTTGKYGAYSMCNSAEQLSFAFNAYYLETGSSSQSCDFNGNAQKQSATISDQCSNLLNQAGPAGTGVVTSAPTGTGAGGAAASSSSGVAALVTVPDFDFGLLKMGTCVTVAVMAGAGMILL